MKRLKDFRTKSLKKAYIIMLVIMWIVAVLVFLDCKSNSEKRDTFPDEPLIDFNKGWVDSNNKPIVINPFSNNKGFEARKIYTYYHKPNKKLKAGDSVCFRALSTDVTLYIGNEKKVTTPYHKRIFTLSSSGMVWYIYTLKESDLNKEFKIKVNAFYNDTSCYIDEMYVGDKATYFKNYLLRQIFSLAVSLLTLFLGLVFILLNIYINIYQKLNKHSLSYIGQFACSIAIWTLCSTHIIDLIPNISQTVQFIACAILYFVPIPALLFINSNFNLKDKAIIKNNIAFDIGLFILALILQFTNIMDLHETLFLAHIVIVISAIVAVYSFIKTNKDKSAKEEKPKLYIRMNYLVYVLFGIFATADVVVYYSNRNSDIGMFTKVAVLFVILYLGIVAFQNLYDLDKQITHNKFVRQLAYTDGLTQLNNRTAYMEKINELERNIDKHSNLGIITFDINFLKTTNDTLGHNMGDDLITSAANIIKNTFNEYCTTYRVGGDEFIAIIDSPDAEKIYKEYSIMFNANINNFNNFYNKPYKLSIAYGCAFYDKHKNLTLNEIIKISDKNMYDNKMQSKKIRNNNT